ncbi:ABC transporter ATP-binding protein [Leadbettera azotonutricia]|uniref:Ribose import ATP-binding protein RbsA 2 n=1 Tax=Leadbettera azotonutricia (strain ATCC BAA-888 / DSM 13862 / ZAS-9) TaxID=545695 RepID=F5Y6Z3_LEAAZ|nr:ABC transporter ATP-binding protein [Leadbettera azotonutricia]AEF83521.1 ribose import ATP-binding protein RbsA 2 [Leadbettera azotonutricia ZAS-9]
MGSPAIEMLDITKIFPGIVANDRIRFEVEEGEIHALLGENGAGKSTLMSILFGLYEPDGGIIKIRGKEVQIRSPNDATSLKIGMVHQHFKLVHNFTVTENIVLGLEPSNPWGNLDLRTAEKRVAQLSETYGLAVDPKARIENITVGMQQRVEILKILYRDASILIFDEPTAVLTPQEIDELLTIFRRLKAEGKTIVFITHKLREIKAAADRCTVLRRGKRIDTVLVSEADEGELAEKMVGRAVSFKIDKKPAQPGDVILKIENLTVIGSRGIPAVHDLSLEVRAGEVVGIAGVDGNGQSELVSAISGLLPVKSGRIVLKGKDIARESIRGRISGGMGLVPEDRHKHGLILDFRLDENLILKSYRHRPYSNSIGFLQFPVIVKHAEDLIADFDIRAGNGPATPAKSMSGGNQQKVVIAREIDLSPELLIVSQPTRGLDVGAIEYIHQRIIQERDKGRAVLLVSFELDEILGLCDRIAAISKGSIAGVVAASEADERRIGSMMGGLHA